jgi:hypothetical protein
LLYWVSLPLLAFLPALGGPADSHVAGKTYDGEEPAPKRPRGRPRKQLG